MGHDSDHPKSLGEVGREGVAVDTLDDMATLFAGIDLGEVSVSMTVNAPGGGDARLLRRRRRARPGPPDRPRAPLGDDPGRHPQGVHRPEGVVLPGRPGDAPVRRHDRVVHPPHASVAPDLDQRLSHPRGRVHGRPGARLHAQGRPDLRRAGDRTRPRRRRLRPPPVVLLQRPDRLLRGDREVPGGPPDLGARAARDVRREEPPVVADALPHADRRRLPDGPAAAQQHRPHGDRGARRRARRNPVAAHQQLRRGDGPADRAGRPRRPAHAADHRPRDGRREHAGSRSAAAISSSR